MTILDPPQITPADLLQMPDAKTAELVDGGLVEKEGSQGSARTNAKLVRVIGNHVEANRLGEV